LNPLFLDTAQHPRRVRKIALIPQKTTPRQLLHPEAVEMKDADWYVQRFHPLNIGEDGFFVITRGEGGREPQSIRPRRQQRRATTERRVLLKDIFHGWTATDVVVKAVSGSAKLHAGHMMRSHLK